MLRCADGSYYVGSTVDLAQRLAQHQRGEGAVYTQRRLPVTLVASFEFESVRDAFEFEKRVQNWSRAKREALARGDYASLSKLARKDFSQKLQ